MSSNVLFSSCYSILVSITFFYYSLSSPRITSIKDLGSRSFRPGSSAVFAIVATCSIASSRQEQKVRQALFTLLRMAVQSVQNRSLGVTINAIESLTQASALCQSLGAIVARKVGSKRSGGRPMFGRVERLLGCTLRSAPPASVCVSGSGVGSVLGFPLGSCSGGSATLMTLPVRLLLGSRTGVFNSLALQLLLSVDVLAPKLSSCGSSSSLLRGEFCIPISLQGV